MDHISVPARYDLPDYSFFDSSTNSRYFLWQPDNVYIVLGRANSIEKSVLLDKAVADNVKIYQRPSGGESVVLSPKMVVFSALFKRNQSEKPGAFFSNINQNLIEHLSELGIENLNSKGISDLSIGDKKIMGSSMYLKGNDLFYHAVLNVSEEVSLISKYLKHPKKEPDYRKGRPHNEFVTSLHAEGYYIDVDVVMDSVRKALESLQK